MTLLPSIPVSLPAAALALAIAAVGGSVQGAVGFGLGLLAAPLLLLVHPSFVPGPLLCAALLLTILVAWRDRRAIDFRGLPFAFIGRVAGTIPAALLLAAVAGEVFDLLFGSLVILAVALSLIGPRLEPSRPGALVAGALSGFMATTASIGGPPMALLYQHAEGSRLRATLAGFFIFGASLSLLALVLVGRFGSTEMRLALILMPGVLLGFVLSGPLARRLDRGGTRPAILGMSLAAAAVVIWRALG